MYISLSDLGLLIVFVLVVAAGIYLIAVLRRIFCVLGRIRGILDDHDKDIRQTLSLLPVTLDNVNELMAGLNAMLEQTGEVICTVQEDVLDRVHDLQEGLENIVVYAKVIAEIFRAIFSSRGK